jgi:hypothetical protein
LAGIARGGLETAGPRRLSDRGLVDELFQALVGAVLSDYDYYNYSTLNSSASHAGHAITRVSNAQGAARAIAPTLAPFAFQCSSSIIRCSQPNMNPEPGLQRLTETSLDFLAITAAEFQFRAVVQRNQKVSV